jgi:hypothetical protein
MYPCGSPVKAMTDWFTVVSAYKEQSPLSNVAVPIRPLNITVSSAIYFHRCLVSNAASSARHAIFSLPS